MQALNAITALGRKASPSKEEIRALPASAANPADRGRADNFQKVKGYLLEEVLG